MTLILWHDSMLVQIPKIDRHHRRLIDLLNQLCEGIIKVHSTESIEILLQELTAHAVYHFVAEERCMEADRYPQLVKHRQEHKQLHPAHPGVLSGLSRGKASYFDGVAGLSQ